MTAALEVFADHVAACEAAANMIIEAKPKTMALAGGHTPAEVYSRLALSVIDRGGIDVFLTDERMLPLDHAASNFRLISEHLGPNDQIRVHPMDTSAGPQEAATKYAALLMPSWPLDLVMLGMGSDGHVASLFPGASLVDTEELVVPTWSKTAGTWRVSLSYRAINGSAEVLVLVTGESKRSALARMLRGDDIPAARISPRGRLRIIADRAAASG